MFQQQNNLLPNSYEEKFIEANKICTYNTRNSKCLGTTFNKLYIFNNSIFDQGDEIWHNLPSEPWIIISQNKLKTYFKFHLLSKS